MVSVVIRWRPIGNLVPRDLKQRNWELEDRRWIKKERARNSPYLPFRNFTPFIHPSIHLVFVKCLRCMGRCGSDIQTARELRALLIWKELNSKELLSLRWLSPVVMRLSRGMCQLEEVSTSFRCKWPKLNINFQTHGENLLVHMAGNPTGDRVMIFTHPDSLLMNLLHTTYGCVASILILWSARLVEKEKHCRHSVDIWSPVSRCYFLLPLAWVRMMSERSVQLTEYLSCGSSGSSGSPGLWCQESWNSAVDHSMWFVVFWAIFLLLELKMEIPRVKCSVDGSWRVG